ncbi:MAG: hypothetical protein AAGF11_38375 [Myxococcota bacterium]
MPARSCYALALALPLGVTPVGCYDGFDPLDPERLAEIARSRGDAQGIAWSGQYVGEVEPLECGCQQVDDANVLSLCGVVDQFGELGLTAMFPLTVIQADGTVQVLLLPPDQDIEDVPILNPPLYGPLDADGRVSAGGSLLGDGLLVRGQVLARIDGTVTDAEGTPTLDAELQQRYVVQLAQSVDSLDIGDDQAQFRDIDCRERVALDLRWFAELPELSELPELDES